jgi:F-type H+-transporting ATPase subunit delta
MPALEVAARRYAQAAFELASRDKTTDEWASALEAIAEFTSEADIKRVLENTRVGQGTKLQLIGAGLGDLPRLPFNLARLLVSKGRTNLAPDIAVAFRDLVNVERGIAHARARTAVPIDDAELATLTTRLRERTGKNVILETEVDPSLLGGIVIQIGDQLVDASTKARLQALRDNLVGAV